MCVWCVLGFAELEQHRVYMLEGLIDLLTDLGTSQDDLARHKDQEDNLGFDHAINQAREQLRLILRHIQ